MYHLQCSFVGEVRLTLCSGTGCDNQRIFTALNFNAIVIDLTRNRSIDSTTLGLLAKLSILIACIGLLPTVGHHPPYLVCL